MAGSGPGPEADRSSAGEPRTHAGRAQTRSGGPDRLRRHRRARAVTRGGRSLALAGLALPVEVRVSARAKRLSLRVDPRSGMAVAVVPPHVDDAEVTRFVTRHTRWLEDRLAAVPPGLPFADGAVLPVLGIDHVVRHLPDQRQPVLRIDGELRVGGRAEHLARRVRDHLMTEARRELTERCHAKAAVLGVNVAGITLRDTRSRWGSCSPTGRLNFNWRLILAPEPVLDYVAAHEVAHLREMNHSPRFWALVARLEPLYSDARAWLKAHGAGLHRYG